MPPNTDRSMQANIVRIKCLRNKVFAHAISTRVDGSTFQYLWQEISQPLLELGIPESDIEEIKTAPLEPDWRLIELKIDECMSVAIKRSVDCFARFAEWSNRKILLKLSNHKFNSKIDNTAKLFSCNKREWLLKEIDNWFVKIDRESMVLLITAGPSFGKTVFAAKVCENFKKSGELAACFFFDCSNSNLKDPMVMLECLASQMCESVPGFRNQLLDSLKRPHQTDSLKAAFQVFFKNTLDNLELDEPVLVVIDGLNEISSNGKDEMINLMADYFLELPKFIKILMTTRPEDTLEKLCNFQRIDVAYKDMNNHKRS